jgi:hypothetical protein
MADTPTVQVDTSQLAALVATLRQGPERLRKLTLAVMRTQMAGAEKRAKEKVSGEVLQRRTGRLGQSIAHRVEEEGTAILGRLGVLKGDRTLVYAAAQEYGATIVPKRAKVLTIPLAAAKYPAGAPRFTAREAAERYPGGTFWQKSRRGNLILFGRTPTGIVPLFVGKTSVTIKPARYLQSTIDETVPKIEADLTARTLDFLKTEGRP